MNNWQYFRRISLILLALAFSTQAMLASSSVVMKLLVVGVSNDDTSYQSITTYLDRLGVPYRAVLINNITPDAAGNRLSSVSFSDTTTGNGAFQGIILTDSSFNVCAATCKSLLSDTDW